MVLLVPEIPKYSFPFGTSSPMSGLLPCVLRVGRSRSFQDFTHCEAKRLPFQIPDVRIPEMRISRHLSPTDGWLRSLLLFSGLSLWSVPISHHRDLWNTELWNPDIHICLGLFEFSALHLRIKPHASSNISNDYWLIWMRSDGSDLFLLCTLLLLPRHGNSTI